MQVKEFIEEIVLSEVKGLCSTCVFADDCIYYKTATKAIIQCEMFESDASGNAGPEALSGLCKTCENAANCSLPGRKEGVWHCNEFL